MHKTTYKSVLGGWRSGANSPPSHDLVMLQHIRGLFIVQTLHCAENEENVQSVRPWAEEALEALSDLKGKHNNNNNNKHKKGNSSDFQPRFMSTHSAKIKDPKKVMTVKSKPCKHPWNNNNVLTIWTTMLFLSFTADRADNAEFDLRVPLEESP